MRRAPSRGLTGIDGISFVEPTERVRRKAPAETPGATITAEASQILPVPTLMVHESFSAEGYLLGSSNPRKENDLSSQELISPSAHGHARSAGYRASITQLL